MIFEIEDYVLNLFLIPLFLSFTGIMIFIASSIYIFKAHKFKDVLISLMFIIASLMLLNETARNLKYGFPLYLEDTSNTTEISGVVSNFEKAYPNPRYSIEGDYVTAYIVTIDGKEYYFMSIGDLEIGDEVMVMFLPKSNIVVEYELLT